MSLLERQMSERGGRCKWLECDSWCHLTKCDLNTQRINILYERFCELGFKYPEVAYMIGGSCDMCEKDYVPKGDFENGYDEKEDITVSEREAIEIAKREYVDDKTVNGLYFELKDRFCKKKEAELEKMADELERMENDELDMEVR